ncbi:hypothetical protein B0H14DRAFT_2753275 [Mycena olivaceomarginata]|nr:hypothetical protein B0H14DRAFT_2753275 [Mycena olivaceomarginata]
MVEARQTPGQKPHRELSWCGISAKRASFVAMILSAASAQLLHATKSDATIGGCNVFRFSSYGALIFNAFAGVTSLILFDRVEDVRLNEEPSDAWRVCLEPVPSRCQSIGRIGRHPQLKYVFIQWILCLFVGAVFFSMQTLAYIGCMRKEEVDTAINGIS